MHPASRKGEKSRSSEIRCGSQSEEVNTLVEMIFNPKTREAHWQFLFIYNSFLMSRFQMNCFHGSPCRRPHSDSCLHKRNQFVAPAYWQMTFENMTSHGHVSVCILWDKTTMDPIPPPPLGGMQLISRCSHCESCCWVPRADRIWKPESRNHSKVHFSSLFSERAPHQRSHVSLLIYLLPTCLLWCLCALRHQPAPPNLRQASNNCSCFISWASATWDQVSTLHFSPCGTSESELRRAHTSPALNKNSHSNHANKKSNLLFYSEGVIRDKIIKY